MKASLTSNLASNIAKLPVNRRVGFQETSIESKDAPNGYKYRRNIRAEKSLSPEKRSKAYSSPMKTVQVVDIQKNLEGLEAFDLVIECLKSNRGDRERSNSQILRERDQDQLLSRRMNEIAQI